MLSSVRLPLLATPTTDGEILFGKWLAAFVPGVAAYADGRQGASSMRLNFSACAEERIAEGIGRIGAVVRDRASLARALGRRRKR